VEVPRAAAWDDVPVLATQPHACMTSQLAPASTYCMNKQDGTSTGTTNPMRECHALRSIA
jgi:hypothetical protein